jgi:hypothetical protein
MDWQFFSNVKAADRQPHGDDRTRGDIRHPGRWTPGIAIFEASLQPIVGITNSAPARIPVGHRVVIAFILV